MVKHWIICMDFILWLHACTSEKHDWHLTREKERETAEEPTANPLEDCYPPISVFGKSLFNQAQKRVESR